MSQAQAKLFKKCHRMLNRELDGVNIYIYSVKKKTSKIYLK